MRKVREVLRLYHAAGMSIRAIARSVGVSPTTAGDYIRRAELQGLTWPLPESVDDAALQRRLLLSPAPAKGTPRRRTDDGLAVYSLDTLLGELATRCRNTCRARSDPAAPPFTLLTDPSQTQRRVAELIKMFPVPGSSQN